METCRRLVVSYTVREEETINNRLGEKIPSFPWNTIQTLLLENEVKLEYVNININGCLIVSGGVLVDEYSKVYSDEIQKKEIK